MKYCVYIHTQSIGCVCILIETSLAGGWRGWLSRVALVCPCESKEQKGVSMLRVLVWVIVHTVLAKRNEWMMVCEYIMQIDRHFTYSNSVYTGRMCAKAARVYLYES